VSKPDLVQTQLAIAPLEVKLGTLGCEASLNRYGYGLNRATGMLSVRIVKPPHNIVKATITLETGGSL